MSSLANYPLLLLFLLLVHSCAALTNAPTLATAPPTLQLLSEGQKSLGEEFIRSVKSSELVSPTTMIKFMNKEEK